MRTIDDVEVLRDTLDECRRGGERIALVPTMGALHRGHLSLVELARSRAERVVASLFVNPRQFAPAEDFASYPRDFDGDAALLDRAGVDLLFAPEVAAMYPPGFATSITVEGPALGLEGDIRPGFFSGVATVVAKLLLQVGADIAVFGEKDYQQLLVVRRLVADLDIPTEIVAGATVREADGLAMSSRNAYLDARQRPRAARLFAVLTQTATAIAGGTPVADALGHGREALAEAFDGLDYLELRDAASLAPVDAPAAPARLLAAVHLGATRLIDNVAVAAEGG